MDYSRKVVVNFTEALRSEYGIDVGRLVFKHLTKDSVHVYYDDELIFGYRFDYIVGPSNMVDMVSLFIENYKKSRVETGMSEISKFTQHDKVFEDTIRRILRELDLDIVKKSVVNNAQEIIEITRKAKEENIKKDIDELESLILEKARDGREGLMFRLSKLKSNILKEESDNEIFKHFRNKGFKCSISNGHSDRYLNITWGD